MSYVDKTTLPHSTGERYILALTPRLNTGKFGCYDHDQCAGLFLCYQYCWLSVLAALYLVEMQTTLLSILPTHRYRWMSLRLLPAAVCQRAWLLLLYVQPRLYPEWWWEIVPRYVDGKPWLQFCNSAVSHYIRGVWVQHDRCIRKNMPRGPKPQFTQFSGITKFRHLMYY